MLSPEEFKTATDDEKLEFGRWFFRNLEAERDAQSGSRPPPVVPNQLFDPEIDDDDSLRTLAYVSIDQVNWVYKYHQGGGHCLVQCSEGDFWAKLGETDLIYRLKICSWPAAQNPFHNVSTLHLQFEKNMKYQDLVSVVEKVNKEMLRTVTIRDVDEEPNEHSALFFELPQIIENRNILSMAKSCINDSQLEKLQHHKIELGEAKNITTAGINKFLKKRAPRGLQLMASYPLENKIFKKLTNGFEASDFNRCTPHGGEVISFNMKYPEGDALQISVVTSYPKKTISLFIERK